MKKLFFLFLLCLTFLLPSKSFSQTQTPTALAMAKDTAQPKLPPFTIGKVYFVRDTVPNVLLVSNPTGPTVWQMGGFSIVEANTLDPELKRLGQFQTVGYLDGAKQPLAKDIIIWSERIMAKQ